MRERDDFLCYYVIDEIVGGCKGALEIAGAAPFPTELLNCTAFATLILDTLLLVFFLVGTENGTCLTSPDSHMTNLCC